MSTRFPASLALVAAALATLPAFAQKRADAIVVTASRTAQPMDELLADVTVIGPEEILRSGAISLAQLLQRQPGVEVTTNGGPGSTSGIFLRGANAGQTLVLIDGLRVGSSSTGSTSVEAIPLDQIDRIEILRGPASSLYGADAMGGVVQVFTKRGRAGAFSAGASAGFGTYASRNVNGGASGSIGDLRLSLHAGATESDGFNAIDNPSSFSYNPDRDGYSTRNVALNAALPWAPGHEISLRVLRNRVDAQTDGGPDFDDRTITTLQALAIVSRDRFMKDWGSTLTAGEGSDDSVSKSAYGDAPFKTTQRQYMWQNDITLPAGMLSLVIERREETLKTTHNFAVKSRDTDAIAGVYQLPQGPWALQANVRRDDSSQYGVKNTGGIAAGYKLLPSLRLTAGYSTGFKAPSFNDLYFPGFSNPNLVPEEARNAELGAYFTAVQGDSRFDARVVAYRNRVENLIVFGCDVDFNCRPDNADRATLEGATLGVGWASGGTRIDASVDVQRPENDANGNLLPRRARRHGTVQVMQQVGPVRFGAQLRASSLRFDDAANIRRMGGYGILNITADWQFARGWTAFIQGNNVLDRNYRLAADFQTGGATVFAGVRWAP